MLHYTAVQFAVFRFIFGIYLACHFYSLIPYGSELFSNKGMIPDPSLNLTWKIFPSLSYFENEHFVNIFLNLLTFVSILFSIGFYRRSCSIFLWYGWAYLLNRNMFILNPGIPYVGWLLLACAVIPKGEGYNIRNINSNENPNWYIPKIIYWGAWFLMAMGYTISGIHKLQCESWLDGSALRHILNSVLARDNIFKDSLLTSPIIVLQIHTWISLMAEILFLPLGLFYHIRKWYWLLFMGIHMGIICLIDFTELTFGVLMIHIFTFDNHWLNEFPFSIIKKFK